MDITHSEIVLLVLIAILFIVIAKQQARLKMIMIAGSGITLVLRKVAEGKGELNITESGEMIYKDIEGNHGTSKQD